MREGAEVGFLWISTTGRPDRGMAWISVSEVEPAHRSTGIGSRMLLAAEDDLRAQGVARLGLHVFGRNTGAQRLYTRLGYGILNQIWQRPATPAGPPGIELRPLPAGALTALVNELIETRPALVARDPEGTPEQARRFLGVAAPDGLQAGNVLARAAYAKGRRVGWIWFGRPTPYDPKLGTIYYLTVDEADRRRSPSRRAPISASS